MVFVATAKSRPPHPACLHFMASSTSRGVVHHILPIISRSPEWLDAHYFSYNNMPSYSYAPNLSVRVHIINILQREMSQSNHKVPKRRRLAPSWDVVDARPPHQLVHGEELVLENIFNKILTIHVWLKCLAYVTVIGTMNNRCHRWQGPVSLSLMTWQQKNIVNHIQNLKSVKCTFCGVWVQTMCALLNCMQPI